MNWLQFLNVEKFLLFTLVLTRVSGLVMTAPVYGTRDIPMQVRGLLAVAISILVLPTQWHLAFTLPQNLPVYIVFIGGELLIGVLLGLGMVIFFQGMQLAGELVSQVGGMQLAEMFDPTTDSNVPLLSRLMFLTATAVFVCIGGHRMVMGALLDTFQAIPPGGAATPQSIVEALLLLVAESFSLAVRAAAPVMISLLLATLVLGLVGRTLPQLNAMVLGFGLNALLIFAGLALTTGGAVWAFHDRFEPALAVLVDALHGHLPDPGPS